MRVEGKVERLWCKGTQVESVAPGESSFLLREGCFLMFCMQLAVELYIGIPSENRRIESTKQEQNTATLIGLFQ